MVGEEAEVKPVDTKFGFEWGAARVVRFCDDEKKGWVVIGLETPRHSGADAVQIYVTKTGMVRVFKGHKELK